MQKGCARNSGKIKGGGRQNGGLRLVTVIYNPTAITLLTVGQYHSPSLGASLDFTGLQEKTFWRQQSRIKHILWLMELESAALCPIHGAGEGSKRRGLTPVPSSGMRGDEQHCCQGQHSHSAREKPCAKIPQPRSKNGYWHPLQMDKNTPSFLLPPPCSLLHPGCLTPDWAWAQP